jgi:hypothetical protein
MRRLAWVAVLVLLGLSAAPARADWNGDGHADVLAESAAGTLFLYRANGLGGWITGSGEQVGGAGWTFPTLLYPGDFSGDGRPDLLAVDSSAALRMYRGNGAGAFAPGVAQTVGSGWAFKDVLAPGDFDGDGSPDLLAVDAQGRMLMYRGNGDGGWITGSGEQIGAGWGGFTAVFAGGDFSGDGHPDVLARTADGHLLLYRGNGAGGWITGHGDVIGSGWGGFRALVLAPGVKTAPPPPPPPAPPAVPVPGGHVRVKAGRHCTVPGGRMRVTLRVRRIPGRAAPRVRRVVFFVPHGSRLVDRHRPYLVHLRMNQPAGMRGRVYARVYFRRAGSPGLRHRTVSRRFRMCGY